jgi:hypothetical protein
MTTNILSAFNEHFMEFINDIQTIFPEDPDILTAKNYFVIARKSNPKVIVKIWNEFIVKKYKDDILRGDITFFLEKDYSADIADSKYSDKIMESIDRLRQPIKQMSLENQSKSMKYIQNLTRLAEMC